MQMRVNENPSLSYPSFAIRPSPQKKKPEAVIPVLVMKAICAFVQQLIDLINLQFE